MKGLVGRWRPLVLEERKRGGNEPLVERSPKSPKENFASTRYRSLRERLHKARARRRAGALG